jgi:hypothetical protein
MEISPIVIGTFCLFKEQQIFSDMLSDEYCQHLKKKIPEGTFGQGFLTRPFYQSKVSLAQFIRTS